MVSSIVAEQFRLFPGAVVRLYSTRNFREVMHAYKTTERPPVREEFAEELAAVRRLLAEKWKRDADGESAAGADVEPVYERLRGVFNEQIRLQEEERIGGMLEIFKEGEWNDAGDTISYPAGTAGRIGALIDELGQLEVEQMDADILKGLKEIVLPKDVEVIGVYQASQHVLTPDLFVPLPLGQEPDRAGRRGAGGGAAGGRSVPGRAGQAAGRGGAGRGGVRDWRVTTWMDQYQDVVRVDRAGAGDDVFRAVVHRAGVGVLDDGGDVHGDDPEAAGDRGDEGARRDAGADRAGVPLSGDGDGRAGRPAGDRAGPGGDSFPRRRSRGS